MAAMTASRLRKLQRALHLLTGALLLAYLYLRAGRELEHVIRFLILPLLALSGMAMWQAPRLRRALKAARQRGSLRLPLAQLLAVAAREPALAEPRSQPKRRR
jgi:hypothetical protein